MSHDKQLDDLYALQQLAPLLVGYPYLPFTAASARPIVLAHLLSDIVINRRCRIVEFGAGVSTVLIARLIARNKLPAHVVSFEHDAAWAAELSRLLAAEGVGGAVEVVHAPLVPCEHALDGNTWYDAGVLASRLGDGEIDLAFVDGPPAWEQGKALARYPAGAFLERRMAARCSIYLDDVDRLGERQIMGKWNARTGWGMKVMHGSFAFASRGDALCADPFAYAR